MGNRIYAVTYGGDPYQVKEIEGESFGINEDGTLNIYNAGGECIAAFSSIVWIYIENVTKKMHKANDELRDRFLGLKPAAQND